MKVLYILKTEPDAESHKMISMLGKTETNKPTEFRLYEDYVDYERLLDLVFEHDKIVSWW